MLRNNKTTIAIAVTVFLIVLFGALRPHEINWTPSFLSEDKIPYGTYILYNSLPGIFEKQDISINTKSVYSLLHKKSLSNASLVFVQNEFAPTNKERKEILAFANKGNTVFISAGHINRGFADALKLTEKRRLFPQIMSNVTVADTAQYAEANFTNPQLHCDSPYLFAKDFYSAFYNINDTDLFPPTPSAFDTVQQVTVLGVDGAQRPAFIRIKYGEGYIFIHNNPFAFTNYYMLKPHGSEYVAKCLSYLPAGSTILWDEYYKGGGQTGKTPLSFILGRTSLRWAYFISVAFLLLFILFNIKRRQRAIPIIEPYKNASLEFTKTVGALYFNQSNHKNIASKKVTYLLEFIRNRYNIDTGVLNEEFARKLIHKSGLSNSAVEHLLNVISGVEGKSRISDTELIDLNHAIEYFKHNCQ